MPFHALRSFSTATPSEHIERGTLAARRDRGGDKRDHVKFVYHNPGVKIPSHLTQSSGIMARFPTPAGVIKKVSDATLFDGLRRWYHEYGYFSGVQPRRLS